ncbi:hypothetical protein KO494_14395 [Lacinutrix sp. C3R15]|uniref:hypothetical protein n=1 Tax=Flavobacteriaceae TaxID=49546 RepID=UPI001C0920CB|nr:MULTISPECIES: hypothetical protein [Flavobacteriaceae]MBU2940735.1 hypothetical protein [Lacinutrix sp. C3R15]MDO6624053.1 hypothetical protein [Oceanihabitans sp. 1_MG-2023]
MKNISIKILVVILTVNFLSCKKEQSSFADYQFAEKTPVITCTNIDNKLLNEALYSFEKDIVAHFDKQQQNENRAYNFFAKQAVSRKTDVTKYASKHSVVLASALRDAGIIAEKGLIYSNPLIPCIAENMKKDDLKTTFNALVSTNSLSKELFQPALQIKIHKIHADKYLSMYVALEYFYAEILKTDFTNVDFNRTEPAKTEVKENINNPKVDFNKRPRKQ